jgi:hypothetical protein
MAGNTLQIVDSIASVPTVLLDLNNESPFGVADFDAPPPQLRRTTSSSMLADGERISQSSYENRQIRITFDQISASQDAWATSWQTLARLIDQDTFWLKYQPTGATSPVFFRCYRTDVPSIEDVNGAVAYRIPTLSIPADHAAYGLPVDIASFTITNDPSSGTNRMIVGPSVLGTIQGDLETPLLLASTGGTAALGTATDPGYVNSYAVRGFTHSLLARDLTELTSSTDVGVTVSGAGTNYIDGNYKSCSFATTTLTTRLTGSFSTALTPMPGLYRVLLRVVTPTTVGTNRADYTFKVTFSGSGSPYYTDVVTKQIAASSANDLGYLVDLGVTQIHAGSSYGAVGLAAPASAGGAPSLVIQAGATVVVGAIPALRFDELFLVPITTTYGTAQTSVVVTPSGGSAAAPLILDGVNDTFRQMSDVSTVAPFSSVPALPSSSGVPTFIGGLPTVVPGANNYLQVFVKSTVVTQTTIWSGRYYPRYLYVRPAST